MFTFLLVVHGLIAAALVGVILVQKSEGGGLGMGSGGPSGLMTARGAADFLTRATTVLATLFILMALALAAYASMRNGHGGDIDTSLAHQGTPGPINAPLPATPISAIPMMGAPAPAAAGNGAAPAPAATGGPANDAAAAGKAPAPEPRAVPSVSHLRTIDTHAAGGTVGINGIGGNSAAAPAKPLATPAVTIPTIKAAAPAKADAAPATPTATGNSAQP